MSKKEKYTVEEKFKGFGVVHFKTSQYDQQVSWAIDKDHPDGFVFLGQNPWPEHIQKGMKESIKRYLKAHSS